MNLNPFDQSHSHLDFDRHHLMTVKKRFLDINQKRLDRMRDALSNRQHIFLEILPLLFHSNHPMMPGFVSRATPSKLSGYKPSKYDIQAARTITRSFTLNTGPDKDEEIYGIYIMGSVGTVAQNESSDLDIWLCHKPGLDIKLLGELDKKATKVGRWAETLGLEVHFFLMDYEGFKQGRLSALNEESSGSAQRLLLLDEFYRSAIFIGGKTPLWWFIPDKSDTNYQTLAHTLLHKKFINEKQTLDFGSVARIPDGEFIGAGIWQLYKAIESPYKSVLKLLLLEAYVSDHPKIEPLSIAYKELVYQGDCDINTLDSYVMIYHKIEDYLIGKKETDRLELARRCFYFKVNKLLSKPPKNRKASWQRKLMITLTEKWGWSKEHIGIMDQRASWKSLRVAEERTFLVNELNHSYKFLLDFANRTGAVKAISAAELTVLGRKLQAAFERRPGKTEWINPNISADIAEDMVIFKEVFDEATGSNVWTAYSYSETGSKTNQSTGIKSSNYLIELTLWCYCNGVVNASTQVEVESAKTVNKQALQKVFTAFTAWLPLPLEHVRHEQFKSVAIPTQVMLLINGTDGLETNFDNLGYQRLSDNNDALRYGGFEENLIFSLDMISRNSWNEISSRHFSSENAFIDCLMTYLQFCLPGTHHQPPKLDIRCINNAYAPTILNRVHELFDQIIACFYNKKTSKLNRFIFQISDKYYGLHFSGLKPHIENFTSASKLLHWLAEEHESFSKIIFDTNACQHQPIKVIAPLCKPNAITVFYLAFDIGIEFFISDEKGSIFHTILRGGRNYNPLKPLHSFLRSVTQRQTRLDEELSIDFGVFPIYFYEVRKQQKHYFCRKQNIEKESGTSKFDVKAVAYLDESNRLKFDFHCEDQEFSGASFGDQLYEVVAQYIIAQRTLSPSYPIYITDIDLSLVQHQLSGGNRLQLIHYLKTKEVLENRLNQAIGFDITP